MKTSELPSRLLPKLYCDLNSCGLSGEPDDNCFYALDREQLATMHPTAGMRVFIWDWSDSELFIGREASLEQFGENWRARPIDEIWHEAKPDETFTNLS
ncbi:MAG TPA: hypothetical protein VGI88_02020 [Verrucomicrobiae bacterium]|jgi:hypothetical protein